MLSFSFIKFFSLYWICYNIASILCFVFLAIRHVLILTPQTGIKPQTPEFKGEVLTTEPPEMSPQLYILLQ